MNNNISNLPVVSQYFPNVAEKVISSVQSAKNPISTKLGQAIAGNGFAALQKFVSTGEGFEEVAAYVQFGRTISKAPTFNNPIDLVIDLQRKMVTYSATTGTIKTASFSTWKKYLRNILPEEVYSAPKAEYKTFGNMVFNEVEKKKSSKVRYIDTVDVVAMNQLDDAARRIEAKKAIAAMEKLAAYVKALGVEMEEG